MKTATKAFSQPKEEWQNLPHGRGLKAPRERDELIYQLRAQGVTVQDIGRRLGISHQRVCQVLKRRPA